MLDFRQVAAQLQDFVSQVAQGRPKQHTALDEAKKRLEMARADLEGLRARIQQSRTSWLLPSLLQDPCTTTPPPKPPSSYSVFAADGSQIVADRHDVVLCYLLNIGSAAICYAPEPNVQLECYPTLALPDETLLEEPEGGEGSPLSGRRLAVNRFLAELERLAEMAETATAPLLLMADGSLILWHLEPEAPPFREQVLERFMGILQRLQEKEAPLVGYISKPQSREVINMLRVQRCPHLISDCDKHCPNRLRSSPHYQPPDCAGLEPLTDADLFYALLKTGERSALFGASSKILRHYAPEQKVLFFYLHTGEEIARVELPAWIATKPNLLSSVHALCYDQAQKGFGYPVALTEAHEQAVVRSGDREVFFELVERALISANLSTLSTRKAISKRIRRL